MENDPAEHGRIREREREDEGDDERGRRRRRRRSKSMACFAISAQTTRTLHVSDPP